MAELHAFAGSPREVATGLFVLPPDVVTSGCYAFLMQGAGTAEVRLFTSDDAAQRGSVEVWRGPGLGDLPGMIAGLLMEGARERLRETVLSALRDRGEFRSLGAVPRPVTARGAFGHPIRPFSGETYLQAYVVTV